MEAQELQPTYCGKTVEEIRGMRMHCGHLFVVEITDGSEKYYAICKEPTMQVIEAAQSISKTSEAKGAMALYQNCVVEQDAEIKARDMLKLQVAAAIGRKIDSLEASVKNV